MAAFILLLTSSWLFSQGSEEAGSDASTTPVAQENPVSDTAGVPDSVEAVQGFPSFVLVRLQTLEPLDYITLSVNLLLFLLSWPMASKYGEVRNTETSRIRLRLLHFINLSLFLCYVIALLLNEHFPKQFSQSCLLFLATFLLIHFTEAFLLSKYGTSTEIEGISRKTETHTSRTLELFSTFLILIVSLVLLINIWGLEGWLQKTSVLGFIALFCFATKEYWVADFLSGILIIGQGRVRRGDVIRIPSEDIFGIVLQTRGLQTIVRDLVRRHDITLPNTVILRNRVDLLKTDLSNGVRDYIEFQIGYGIASAKVEAFLGETWENACKQSSINGDQGPHIALKDCGDHAATWRLSYTLKSPHHVILCRNEVRKAAYDLQDKHGIQVSTPLTHRLLEGGKKD